MIREQPQNPAPDTTPIFRLINRTRRLLRSSWVATGLGIALGLLLGALAATTALDLATPLGVTLRLVALLLVVLPATWALLFGVVLPLFRRLAATQMAHRIEVRIPNIHNRLVSCVDLTVNKDQQPRSPAFYRRLVQEAIERIRGFKARSVVDFLSLRRAGLAAGLSTFALLIVWALFSDRVPTAMARIFSPFADIPPASGVVYSVEPGNAKFLRGEDIPFVVHVERGQPENLRLEMRGSGGETLWYDLQPADDGEWHFVLGSTNIGAGFDHGFRYRVHGGGTWSQEYTLTLLERPSIVDLHTLLHYPQYMGIPEPRVGASQVADVTGPEGSSVEVVVQAEGDVANGEIQFLKPERRTVEVKERPEHAWFSDQIPAGAAGEGSWLWDKQQSKPRHSDPPNGGVHTHGFHSAPEPFPVRAGENLFAYVFIPTGQKVETIMMQWHDGRDWEHRAYWGQDKIHYGAPNTPARLRMGALPQAGRWVRLEVPAEKVGLENKSLRGISFAVHGGKCYWRTAGAVVPPQKEMVELVPSATFPMQPSEPGVWAGRFPLAGTGFYRAELRNQLGYANKTMKEGKYIALPDNPPQIVVERPATDLVLGEAARVPLVVAAYDDYGLADVTLAVQRGDGGFIGKPLKRYEQPVRSDTVVGAIDLPALQMKPGEEIRYRLEARDRKGQVAQSREYSIRLVQGKSPVEHELEALEKAQDSFLEKLLKLISEQMKVRNAVEKLSAKYAPLQEKIKEAQAQAEQATPKDSKQPTAKPAELNLDAESAKALQDLRQELGDLSQQEKENAQFSEQIAGDMKNQAEQAGRMPLLPKQVADEMKELENLFRESAVAPLQDLASKLEQARDRKNNPPQVGQMQRQADRVQQELEAMKARLQALAQARKDLHGGSEDALAALQRELTKEDARLSERDLEALKELIAALRKELKAFEGKQDELLKGNNAIPDPLLAELAKQQARLEKQAEPPLGETRKLQRGDKLKKLKERQRAQETDDEAKASEKENGSEDDPRYMPALGGPRPKAERPQTDKPADPNSREGLRQRGERERGELDEAEQSLASDQQSLEAMLQQLRDALRSAGKESGSEPKQAGETEQSLEKLLRSQALQEALQMAARMRHAGEQEGGNAHAGAPSPSRTPIGNQHGSPVQGTPADELRQLDLATQQLILKMQPKLREELLQSMREEGPEGYRKFIQDYFRRLSQEKKP
jgi:hypothetical protein